MMLETGISQPEALGLYERSGYVRRGPYGDYPDDPLSVFMHKRLTGVQIERSTGELSAADLDALAVTLHACVQDGASVGFVLPFTRDDARAFWRQQLPAVQAGARRLLLARSGGEVVGTVQLAVDVPANGRHRAEVCKLLVHPKARHQGAARALMQALEALARAEDRSLLVLDTRQGDKAEALYRSLGFALGGVVPGYARSTSGTLDATSFMHKALA